MLLDRSGRNIWAKTRQLLASRQSQVLSWSGPWRTSDLEAVFAISCWVWGPKIFSCEGKNNLPGLADKLIDSLRGKKKRKGLFCFCVGACNPEKAWKRRSFSSKRTHIGCCRGWLVSILEALHFLKKKFNFLLCWNLMNYKSLQTTQDDIIVVSC